MLKLIIILAAVAVCHGQTDNRIYRLFTRGNTQPQFMKIGDSGLPATFVPENKTIVLIHGHRGSVGAQFNTRIIQEIFEFRREHNIIVVDWETEASHAYSVAYSYVIPVANDLARFLRWLAVQTSIEGSVTDTPTSEEPTTEEPTTEEPTTEAPTTEETTTEEPTTEEPTTEEPTTEEPTTEEPTTEEPTTEEPTTEEPTTEEPTTEELDPKELLIDERSYGRATVPRVPLVLMEKLHLVGFGLGAHIAGIASRQLKDSPGLVGRITGLDPAGSGWGSRSPRLNENDANYVEVIHTDSIGILANGIGTAIGDIDIYANGGSNQPGCFSHACSHARAWELFAASMRGHLNAYRCSSKTQMNLNLCKGREFKIGGTEVTKEARYGDIYRINTKRNFPF